MEDRTFIIVLGDTDNKHYMEMLESMNRLGETRRILDNTYVLTTSEETPYEEIRNRVSGSQNGYCIVVSIKGLRAAWNLSPFNSEFLKSFFESSGETKETK